MATLNERDSVIFSFGVIVLVSVCIGVTLNLLALPFYLSRQRYLLLSNMLYCCIILNDLLTCLSTLPSGISYINDNDPGWLRHDVVCAVSGFTFNITARMSVFLIAVLSVIRSISILLPFKVLQPKNVVSVIGVYLFLNIVLASLPLLFSDEGYFIIDPSKDHDHTNREHLGFCSWGLEKLSFVGTIENNDTYVVLTYLTIIIPWLIPGFVVIISCILSIQGLRLPKTIGSKLRGNPANRDQRALSKDHPSYLRMPTIRNHINHQAKITIMIITIVYMVFNMPCWLYYLFALYATRNPVSWLRGNIAKYFVIFTSLLSVVMNASINPIIYISRTRQLRLFLSGKEAPRGSIRGRNIRLGSRGASVTSFTLSLNRRRGENGS